MLGARSPQVLRPGTSSCLAPGPGSLGTDRSFVCDPGGGTWTTAGRATTSSSNPSSSFAPVLIRLVRSLVEKTFSQVGHDSGDSLCTDAVAGVDPVLRRRSLGDRQQRCGTCFACSYSGAEELSFCWFRCRRGAGGRHLQSDWHGETQ